MAATLFQPISHVGLSDFRSDLDISPEQLSHLLDLTQQVKQSRQRYGSALKGRSVALLFEKPSLRTRMTFELAIKQLGGDAVVQTGLIGDREPLKDVARNLDRWTDAIVARTFSQQTVDDLAAWSRVPVINALSDLYHPCQALADLYTLKEQFGRLKGLKLAYIGDGNNVAQSLLLDCARLGINISVATPKGYEPEAAIVAQARTFAAQFGAEIEITNNAENAVVAANAVYTDVWASMGQETEAADRKALFADYQVDATLMSEARRDAVFMHCLPAKRGQEVTDEVIESAQSVVFDQAENRLHTQKALLLSMLQ
ncbi:MAG: ornithine carbamoyltransferase [Bryobacteraceae bacterium]